MREKGIAFLLYSAVVFFLFVPVFFQKKTFVPAHLIDLEFLFPPVEKKYYDILRWDGIMYAYSIDEFYRREMKKGNFPLWNPHSLAGHPVFANGHNGFLLPLKFILSLFLHPYYKVRDLFSFVHLIFTGFFMFLYLRALNLNFFPSLCGGFLYMLNSFMAFDLYRDFWISLAPFLPLLFLSYEKVIKNFSLFWTGIGGLSTALILLNRYLPDVFCVYFLFLLRCACKSLDILFSRRTVRNFRQVFLPFVLFSFTGFLISFIQMAPAVELILLSLHQRMGASAFLKEIEWRIDALGFNFFSPFLLAIPVNPITTPFSLLFNITACYGGIISVFLLTSAILLWNEKREVRFFLIGSLISFLFLLNLPGLIFPFLNRLFFPFWFRSAFTFFFSVSAACGLQKLENGFSYAQKYFSILIPSFLSRGSGTIVMIYHSNSLPLGWMSLTNIIILSPVILVLICSFLFYIDTNKLTRGILSCSIILYELVPIFLIFNRPVSRSILNPHSHYFEEIRNETEFYRISGLEPALSSLLGFHSPDGFEALIPDW